MNDLVGALADFDQTLRLKPRLFDVYNSRGAIYFERGDWEKAIADFNRALALNSRYSSAYYNRALAYYAQGNRAAAVPDLIRAIELFDYVDRAKGMIESNPFLSEAHMLYGNIKMDGGDVNGAIAEFSRAIEADPDSIGAYNNRGVAWHVQGNLDRAAEDYEQTIRLDPTFAPAYLNLGTIRGTKGELDMAIADYNRAIEINPNLSLAFDLRGTAREEKGEMNAAIADYNHAIKLNPQLITTYIHRGMARYSLRDWDRAIADLTKALELYSRPDSATDPNIVPLDQITAIGKGESRQQGIIGYLARAYAQRGLDRLRQRKVAEAEQDFTRALELDPGLKARIEQEINQVKRQLAASR